MYIEITPDDYRVQFRYQALPDYGSEIIPFAKLKQDLVITLADDVADKTFADIAFAIAHDVAVILNDTERKVYARLSAYDDGNSYTFDALTDDGRGVWKVTNEDVWTYELVPIGGGSSDHRELEHRDAANQHPISAITGLQPILDEKLEYVEQTLTDAQKAQARENIGIDGYASRLSVDSVKTNGNIVLTDGEGNKKEFMAATPSGDPMHYAYVEAGAEYNATGADITKTAPWGESVTHKAGYWYMSGLGDITNEELRAAYPLRAGWLSFGANAKVFSGISNRFIFRRKEADYVKHRTNFTSLDSDFASTKLIVIDLRVSESDSMQASLKGLYTSSYINYLFYNNPQLEYILGQIYCYNAIRTTDAFGYCPKLIEVRIYNLQSNISFNRSPVLSNKSILYMIAHSNATSAITITLHADAYARATADTDIQAALTAHPLVTLASA